MAKAGWLFGLAGLALGLAAGRLVPGGAKPSSPSPDRESEVRALGAQAAALGRTVESQRAQLALQETRVQELQAELGVKEAALASLAAKVQETAGGRTELGKDEVATKGLEIRARFEAALAKKDGKGVLAALKALLSLGKDGYPLAAELWLKVHEDFNGGNSLGLSYPQYYQSLGDPGFCRWAIREDGAALPVKLFAVGGMPWVDQEGAAAFLAASLEFNREPSVLLHMASQLGELSNPETAPVVLAWAQNTSLDAKVRGEFVAALGSFDTPEARQALAVLATDPDPLIRSSAKVAGILQNPPAQGMVLTTVTAESQAAAAGLQRGDLLISYNGQVPSSWEALVALIGRSDPQATIPIQFYRDGALQTVTVKGGRVGITGSFVKPK